MAARIPLSRERIVAAAVAVADRAGIAGVSMRAVAAELGVEAMSLYHHIASKDALLDALADAVFERIALPQPGSPWREAMAQRARSARAVFVAHPWALGMLESRPVPGAPLLRHHDRVLGILFDAGFGVRMAIHAFSAIDAYVYGYALTETGLPFAPDGEAETEYAVGLTELTAAYPNLARMRADVAADGFAFSDELEYGLGLLLDGIAERAGAV